MLLREIWPAWQGVGYETISSELSALGSHRNCPPGTTQPTAICIKFSRTAKPFLVEETPAKMDRVSSVHLAGVADDPDSGSLHLVNVNNTRDEECRLLGCDAVRFLKELTFRRKVSPPPSG
jgi:hypothetical protein